MDKDFTVVLSKNRGSLVGGIAIFYLQAYKTMYVNSFDPDFDLDRHFEFETHADACLLLVLICSYLGSKGMIDAEKI